MAGQRTIWLKDDIPAASADVFPGSREIGHFHPRDASLHMVLEPGLAKTAVAGLAPEDRVMLYGPRDGHEAEVICGLIQAAVKRATTVRSAKLFFIFRTDGGSSSRARLSLFR